MVDRDASNPEVYQLEDPEPTPPALPGTVVARRDEEDLHGALAADLLAHAKNCVRAFGDFHLALSGGSTPMPFYRRLVLDPAYRSMPWERTHIWIVDERRVPFTDDRSNFASIRDLLIEHVDIAPSAVHPIAATEADADTRYETELRDTLGWRERGHDRLDFVLLGMGADAHTASLFPNSPALDAPADRLAVVNSGPTVTPPDRVTMTYALINASRLIAVLATGEKKRSTIQALTKADASQRRDMPILGVEPVGGTLRWYLDAPACPR